MAGTPGWRGETARDRCGLLHPHRRSTRVRGALLDMVRASTLSFTVGGCYPLTSSHTEFEVCGRHSMAFMGPRRQAAAAPLGEGRRPAAHLTASPV